MSKRSSPADHDRTRAGRRPRLEDVARRVGLSTASVSLVLSNAPGPSAATRQRVLEAAADLGYRPDRNASLLARRRRHLLGVMMDVRNAFHAELVQHLLRSAESVSYDLVLSPLAPTHDEQRAVETLLDFRCEALMLLGPDVPSARLVALGRQVPVVVVGRRIDAESVDVVRAADDKGVGQTVDYLAGLGHRRIAFIDGGKGTIASDRRRGYRTAMRRHQLTDHVRIIPGDHTEEAGTRAAQSMLAARDLPSAVMASNDRCALGVLDALNRAGVDVPGSVSLVGYDDSILARLAHIDLTTVSQNAREQAEQAVAAVVERLDSGRATPREVVLNPRLVVRSTTGPPRSAVESDGAAVRPASTNRSRSGSR
ncbi:MAG: LacI family transcriptional regulator [Candidatus Nephthysia bennettiae]|uniref:LacI family DNA-binding transcriptional regulator n=1 Tax=Candidatus Nephthysia bennettiae TaxID=3127016 RepID=A0A934KBE4_9BACT|nr:LacI family DNA-binding transcriptional regulator [Candidatus Dormibacteraeota bacterium]MBJ7614631.1 LacI family DNA-binding transcriptional regulator [Candidatus Dormibacteraeota bacterium]PZR92450.1 MAG: LacI family transcriptional regulator [Candidatus Dormibacteraeota bacterium]